jgi:IclR family KDG regulon transcriptional repressor
MERMNGENAGVKVLHKTLDILEAIRENPQGLALAEITRSVGMPKPTVYRILLTLHARGYVGRQHDGRYLLARKLFSFPEPDVVQQLLLRTAPPLIEELVDKCRETVNLGILDGGEVLITHTVESPQAVRMTSKTGNRRNLHSTALGKVLISALTDPEILQLVRSKGMPGMTQYSLSTSEALLAEIRKVRKRGYAVDNQENELEGRCIAAGIAGPDGRSVAALSISVPAFRIDLIRLKSLLPALKETCALISSTLGGPAVSDVPK